MGGGPHIRFAAAVLSLPNGTYRLVVAGESRDAARQRPRWVRRGPIVRVCDNAFADSLSSLWDPPQIPSVGIPVGVWLDGYGGQPLRQILQNDPRWAALPVHFLAPAVLQATRLRVLLPPASMPRQARVATG